MTHFHSPNAVQQLEKIRQTFHGGWNFVQLISFDEKHMANRMVHSKNLAFQSCIQEQCQISHYCISNDSVCDLPEFTSPTTCNFFTTDSWLFTSNSRRTSIS